jgi:MFS family permease
MPPACLFDGSARMEVSVAHDGGMTTDTTGVSVFGVAAKASVITVAFMGSVVVSPLYPLYQDTFGFSDLTLTLVYAVYAVGNVIALLVLGQISDQIGRKRAALPGLALAAVSGLLFLLARSTAWLFAARLLTGVAVGICSGTGTAWLAEQYGPGRRSLAALVATTANLAGIALGPVVGGVLAQYAPAPLVTPLVVYLVAVLASAIAVLRTADTKRPHGRSLRRLRVRPRVGVPREILPAFAAPTVTALAIFALGGLYFALIPGIMVRDLHETSSALSGLVITQFAAVAVAGVWLTRRLRPLTAMRTGLACLLPAALLVTLAQGAASLPTLIAAAGLGGLTLSMGYRGSLEVVNQIAPDDRRAEVVSGYFVACFLGNSLPIIGIGLLATLTGPLSASATFAAVIAAVALGTLLWRPRQPCAHQAP